MSEKYESKFRLTVEENIFIAKRNIVDYIWESAKLEGLSVTFPDTEEIIEGRNAPAVPIKDIIAVNNLKRAWQFNIETIESPISLAYISQINKFVGGDNLILNSGMIRNIPVRIGGTLWRPEIPNEQEASEAINKIMEIDSPTERSITLMLYCMRSQLFIDGNKRTAMLAGNHEMIRNGCGIISIPINLQNQFKTRLVEFYESNEIEPLKWFVYDNCIDGIDFRLQEKRQAEKQAAIEVVNKNSRKR